MSRTDRHRPIWVQMNDPENRWVIRQYHSQHLHARGECDLPELERNTHITMWRTWGAHCHWSVPFYGYSAGLWSRGGKKSWVAERRLREGGIRAQWIKHRKNLLNDPEDYEGDIRPRHRHGLLWDMW